MRHRGRGWASGRGRRGPIVRWWEKKRRRVARRKFGMEMVREGKTGASGSESRLWGSGGGAGGGHLWRVQGWEREGGI